MSISLTYFDYNGSRGLECRLAFTLAKVPFEDVRLNQAQWADMKASTPFGSLPVLDVDGRRIAQSNAILGYIGRTYGLHPKDTWEAARHEAMMHAVEDLRNKMPSGNLPAEEKKAKREEFATGWLTQFAKTVESQVVGPFFGGAEPQVADIKLYSILRSFRAGAYDHIPATFFEAYPKTQHLLQAMEAHPQVRAYLTSVGL